MNAQDRVEAIGVARAERLIEAADVLVWLGDPHEAPAIGRWLSVHAKADLPGRALAPEGSVAVSSTTGEGLPALLQAVEQ